MCKSVQGKTKTPHAVLIPGCLPVQWLAICHLDFLRCRPQPYLPTLDFLINSSRVSVVANFNATAPASACRRPAL